MPKLSLSLSLSMGLRISLRLSPSLSPSPKPKNLPRWSSRYGWRAGQYKKGISSFRGHHGGASPGAGCTAEAMADVYKHHNRS